MKVFVIGVAGAGLALAACGFGGVGNTGGDCIIVATGNKLCGDDAKAYCQRFVAQGAPDRRSAEACRGIGVPVAKTPEEREAERAEREEAEQRRQAAEDRAKIAAEEPYRRAVEPILGDSLSRVFVATDGSVSVDVIGPKPSPATLNRVCAAIHRIKDVSATVDSETGETFKYCPASWARGQAEE